MIDLDAMTLDWLRQRQIEPSKELIDAILAKAKSADHILEPAEVFAVVEAHRGAR